MKVKVYPAVCSGAVRACRHQVAGAPGAALCRLAEGTSRITGVSSSEDMAATCGALEALGAKVVRSGDCCTVSGCGGALFDLPETAIDCRESGSTLRFLIPGGTGAQSVHLTGHGRLMERSQSVYETLFAQQGLRFERQTAASPCRDRCTAERSYSTAMSAPSSSRDCCFRCRCCRRIPASRFCRPFNRAAMWI